MALDGFEQFSCRNEEQPVPFLGIQDITLACTRTSDDAAPGKLTDCVDLDALTLRWVTLRLISAISRPRPLTLPADPVLRRAERDGADLRPVAPLRHEGHDLRGPRRAGSAQAALRASRVV